MYRKPHAVYCDRDHDFISEVLKSFMNSNGTAIDYSPSGSSKSTGLVEVSRTRMDTDEETETDVIEMIYQTRIRGSDTDN
jgi:hypothetical protein